jgi:LysM repeat protein
MTSDAKIGLLLGLVFIFIIAFLINGLPTFSSDNNNELTSTMFSSQNDGLGARERKVIEQNEPIIRYRPVVQLPPRVEPDIRFEMPLPKGPLDRKAIAKVKSVGPSQSFATAKETHEPKVQSKKQAPPKAYVVMTGDSLTVIARKFYGAKEGNRLANIKRIFQANRRILKSADQIYEGQRIIVPPLPGPTPVKKRLGRIFPSKVLEKIGIRRNALKGKEGGRYVVRDGDSLWRISAEQLGDGTRYTEIAKLNADILDDEDSLSAGMRLKMPRR